MAMYKWYFFETEQEAKDFQRKNGGKLYSDVKYSRTKNQYDITAMMAGATAEFRAKHPYVIWKYIGCTD